MTLRTLILILVVGFTSSVLLPEPVDAQLGRAKKTISAIKKRLKKLGPHRNRARQIPIDAAMMQDALDVVSNGGQPRAYQGLKARSTDPQASRRDRNTATQALGRAKVMLATAFLDQTNGSTADQIAAELVRGNPALKNQIAFLRNELGAESATNRQTKDAQRLIAASHVKALVDSGANVLLEVSQGKTNLAELGAAERYYRDKPGLMRNTTRSLHGKARQVMNMQRLADLGTPDRWASEMVNALTSGNPAVKAKAMVSASTLSKAAEAIPPGFPEGKFARDALESINAKLRQQPNARVPEFAVSPGTTVAQMIPNPYQSTFANIGNANTTGRDVSLSANSYGQLSLIPSSYGELSLRPPARGAVYVGLPEAAAEAQRINDIVANLPPPPPAVIRNQYVAAPANPRN